MTRKKAPTRPSTRARAYASDYTEEEFARLWTTDRPKARWVVERRVVAGVVCQLQWVKCGKRTKNRDEDGNWARVLGCWCEHEQEPPFHGPYWYAYTLSSRGKLRPVYIGKVISAKRVRAAVG